MLKGIIRVNKLSVADGAVFPDEPIRFLVGARDEADALRIRAEVEALRQSGKLAAAIQRMVIE